VLGLLESYDAGVVVGGRTEKQVVGRLVEEVVDVLGVDAGEKEGEEGV
jgi:hypothetical protein